MGVSSQYVASSASIADGSVTEAKLAAQACSAAKMKKEGTAGHVLTSNGTGAVPSYQPAGAAAMDYELISTQTLVATANSIEFSGISGYARYKILFDVCGHTDAGSSMLALEVNGDSTTSDYSHIVTYSNGTTQTLSYATTEANFALGGMQTYQISGEIMISDLRPTVKYVSAIFAQMGGTNTAYMFNLQGFWEKDEAITQLKLLCTSGNFKVGSTASIYGIRSV